MNSILKLTVALPNFNGGLYLESAIRSCDNIPLPHSDFEILVVDNQSEDNSVNVVSTLQTEYPNIRIEINVENIGRLPNWDRCIQLANGKYFHFLFVTDQFLPGNQLDRLIEILDRTPSVAMCVSTFMKHEDKDQTGLGNKYTLGLGKTESYEFIRSRLMKGYLNHGILSNLMRTEDISEIHFDKQHPFTADHIFSALASIKRTHIFFNETPRFAWNIYKNPNRFHANTTLEQTVRDRLGTAGILASLVDIPASSLHVFYARECNRVLRYRLKGNDLIAQNSNYMEALRQVFLSARETGIGRSKILFYLVFKRLKQNLSALKRKISLD